MASEIEDLFEPTGKFTAKGANNAKAGPRINAKHANLYLIRVRSRNSRPRVFKLPDYQITQLPISIGYRTAPDAAAGRISPAPSVSPVLPFPAASVHCCSLALW